MGNNERPGGTRWRGWLRHCVTSRKVAGSIPDVARIFHLHNPSGRTMALGLTQRLTEMSRLRLKCDGICAETRFRLSGETDESI